MREARPIRSSLLASATRRVASRRAGHAIRPRCSSPSTTARRSTRRPRCSTSLDQHDIKAVFFVNGLHFQGSSAAAEQARALLREELRRGHAVGNHTVHHYFLCGQVYTKRRRAGDRGQRHADRGGDRPASRSVPHALRRPLQAAHARRSPGSASSPSAGTSIRRTGGCATRAKIEAYVEKHLATLHGRAIVLFHDVQAATVEALPQILDWLDKENARRVAAGRAADQDHRLRATCCPSASWCRRCSTALGARAHRPAPTCRRWRRSASGPARAAACLASGPGVASAFSQPAGCADDVHPPRSLPRGSRRAARRRRAPRHGQPAQRSRGPREADRPLAASRSPASSTSSSASTCSCSSTSTSSRSSAPR